MSELLVEVRSEVLPPTCAEGWAVRLKESLVASLRAVDLAPRQSAIGHSGRRLMVLLRGVGEHARNPPANRGEELERAAKAVRGALTELSRAAAADGWSLASGGSRAVAVLAVLDGEIVPAEWNGLTAGGTTVGHRVGAPEPVVVASAEEYRQALERSGVEIRLPERRRLLAERITALLAAADVAIDDDAALLARLAAECECPTPVLGRFDPALLDLPRELVRAVLRERQLAFTVSRGGRPTALFLAVLDHPEPVPASVVGGYELAVANLLDDVRFHWTRDRALPIAERARRVEAAIRAGGDPIEIGRRDRLRTLALQVCADAGWGIEVVAAVRTAIDLLDADLDTSLGRQFPELLGVIGGLLARAEGHPEPICHALYDHPLPPRPRSTLPRGPAALAVAAALRADQVALDCRADSEASRVAAADLVRVLMHGGVGCDVDLLAARACRLRDDSAADSVREARGALSAALAEVLGAEGFSSAEINAVCAGQGSRLLPDVLARARGLARLRDSQRLRALVATAKRLTGILDRTAEATVDARLLVDQAERELYTQLEETGGKVRRLLAEGRYQSWLSEMGKLDAAVERFLAEVLVHDDVEEIRTNRLALLQAAQQLYTREVGLAQLDG